MYLNFQWIKNLFISNRINIMKNIFGYVMLTVALVFANINESVSIDELRNMSLEELMNVKVIWSFIYRC